jgi:hypothetical protein
VPVSGISLTNRRSNVDGTPVGVGRPVLQAAEVRGRRPAVLSRSVVLVQRVPGPLRGFATHGGMEADGRERAFDVVDLVALLEEGDGDSACASLGELERALLHRGGNPFRVPGLATRAGAASRGGG